MLSLALITVAAGSLTALLISQRAPLFGFMGTGYRRAIVLALAAAAVLLGEAAARSTLSC